MKNRLNSIIFIKKNLINLSNSYLYTNVLTNISEALNWAIKKVLIKIKAI